MLRTKWMRLQVRDLSDVLRWAAQQKARHITDFRHRVINGRESVSFRLLPDYSIQVGSRDIIVVCHVRAGFWQSLLAPLAAISRRSARRATIPAQARLDASPATSPPVSANLYAFPSAR